MLPDVHGSQGHRAAIARELAFNRKDLLNTAAVKDEESLKKNLAMKQTYLAGLNKRRLSLIHRVSEQGEVGLTPGSCNIGSRQYHEELITRIAPIFFDLSIYHKSGWTVALM